jgi:hypothetical protein
VTKQLARHQHQVRLPGSYDVVGLLGRRDEPHDCGRNAGLGAHAFGERSMVSRAEWYFRTVDHAA